MSLFARQLVVPGGIAGIRQQKSVAIVAVSLDLLILGRGFYRSAMRRLITILAVIYYGLGCPARAQQQRVVDSVQALLPTATKAQKVDIYDILALEYTNSQPSKARQYADSARQAAKKVGGVVALNGQGSFYGDAGQQPKAITYFNQSLQQDTSALNKKRVARHLTRLGNNLLLSSDYRSAINYYQPLLKLSQATQNWKNLAVAYGNIGTCYQYIDQYAPALSYLLKGLQVAEKHHLSYFEGPLLNLISEVHEKRNDYAKALLFRRKALHKSQASGNERWAAVCESNLGNIFIILHQPDSALVYTQRALTYFQSVQDSATAAVVLNDMGRAYQQKNQLRQALRLTQQALPVLRLYERRTYQVSALNQLAEIYYKLQQFPQALAAVREGQTVNEETQILSHSLGFQNLLAQIYAAQGEYAKAYAHQNQQLLLRDSLFQQEKEKSMQEMETLYATEKKDGEITFLNQKNALQQAQLARQALLRNGAFGALLLVGLLGFIGYRNVRLRQKHQQQLLQQQQELDETKSRFFANIAHEFRTPLTLIQGPAEQISQQTQEPIVREWSHLIQRQSGQLQGLINQILEVSKLESGLVPVNLAPGELVGFLQGLIAAFESLAEQQDIQLTFHSDLAQWPTLFDRPKLEQVFNNLLSNAFKFTSSGGRIRVNLSQSASGAIVVQVTDTGTGFAPMHLPHVFDRFYQADDSLTRKTAGTGIGLALTKELVELLNGTIRVASQPGQGTTFTVGLPLPLATSPITTTLLEKVPSTLSQPNQEATKRSESAIPLPSPELTEVAGPDTPLVLLIEDNREVRAFIRQTLAGQYQILEAPDGLVGLSLAREHVPDLIITDLMMPELDGYEVCRQLKQEEKTSHIPIVMLTAKAGMESKLHGLELGADDYLAKPFHTPELLIRLQNLLLNRKRLQEKYQRQQSLSGDQLPLAGALEPALPPVEDAFLQKLRLVIEVHESEADFSIEELSRELGMSRTQVHRKLKALTNLSASLFIRQVRLQKAWVLLRQTELSISEIAYQVGFSSPNYFTRCFTEQYTQTPSEVRQPREKV